MNDKKHIKNTFSNSANAGLTHCGTESSLRRVTIDTDYFQSFLDDVDISDAQKTELVETLWQIVVNFIELGFQVHPLNEALPDERDSTAQALQHIIGEFAGDALDILDDYGDERAFAELAAKRDAEAQEPEDTPPKERSEA